MKTANASININALPLSQRWTRIEAQTAQTAQATAQKRQKREAKLAKAQTTREAKRVAAGKPPPQPRSQRQIERSQALRDKPPADASLLIRLYPTPAQRATLNQWIGTARWTYNRALTVANERGFTLQMLRENVVDAVNFATENTWVTATPYDIRQDVVRDLIKGFQSNCEKQLKNPQHRFKMAYRSKKDANKSFVVGTRYIKVGVPLPHGRGQIHIFPKAFGTAPLKTAEPVPDTVHMYDSRIVKTAVGHYFLSVPTVVVPQTLDEHIQGPERVLALDPGVRSFMTGYSPLGLTVEWGARASTLPPVSPLKQKRKTRKQRRKKANKATVETLIYKADQLMSAAATTKHLKHRRGLLLAAQRLRDQVRNKTNDLHRKLARWTCENYDVVLLPTFATQQMSVREGRVIRSKTVRSMLTWAHYRFRQHLLHKAREYPWVRVVVCTEEYTSKTCTLCGHIHDVGGQKTVTCPQCGVRMDRDDRGARNIYLKNENLLAS